MAGSRSDDELARTATADGSTVASKAEAIGKKLGRYRLERMLGEGGMGVVHAAFDPDLERRVALKVLRTNDGGDEARQRLLREARAMARLTHANVVTVHEVGSADGRDYVAMELIDGETLAEWLRSEPRKPHDIIAAFIVAGRGLSAAHAAGLVHRDFKPHNVLRRRDGRIVVTDFGLARGVEAGDISLEATLDIASPKNTPSSLSGLTRTGSVLGTPAYMAPEQWSGGTVGPAADQFAFCVALWEALTGKRPYGGETFDQLKAAVARGTAGLDTTKLPRRLRQALVRGLDPDPDKRWPSMDALLGKLLRAERRPAYALFAAAGLVVAGAALFVATRPASKPQLACDPAARDVAAVWPANARDVLAAAGRGELADVLAKDIETWRADRDKACTARKTPQLSCLDGVLARFDAIRKAVEEVPGELTDNTIEQLVDPNVCMVDVPPRLLVQSTDDTVEAMRLLLLAGQRDTTLPEADPKAFAAKPGLDACARAWALESFVVVAKDVDASKTAAQDAVTAAEACGDERMRADTLLLEAPYEYESPFIGARGRAAIEKAKIAIDRVAQPDLVAEIDQERATVAAEDGHWDTAFELAKGAIDKFGQRGRPRAQIGAAEVVNSLRLQRNTPADIEDLRAEIAKWTPVAEKLHDEHFIHALAATDAFARLFLGDTEGAHPEIIRQFRPRPDPDTPTQRIEGVVVDANGKPVAGATVAAGRQLFADSIGPFPFGRGGDASGYRSTTTDASGAFTIPDGPMAGSIVAAASPTQRSPHQKAAAHVRLVIGPTRRIAGKVNLGNVSRTKSFVFAAERGSTDGTYMLMSPIKADGSFDMVGAPTDALRVGIANWGAGAAANVNFIDVPAGTTDRTDVVFEATSTGRTFDVIVRSTVAQPFDGGQAFVVPGAQPIKTIQDLNKHHDLKNIQIQIASPIVGEKLPKSLVGKTQPGDVIAHFTNVPPGELRVCAIGWNGSFNDAAFVKKFTEHANDLQSACKSAAAGDEALIVDAPPQKRFQ